MPNMMLEREIKTSNEEEFSKEATPLFDKISELCEKHKIEHAKIVITSNGNTYTQYDMEKTMEAYKGRRKSKSKII